MNTSDLRPPDPWTTPTTRSTSSPLDEARKKHPARRARRSRPAVEIVRHPEGPVEIQLSGLVGALERRARQWRAVALVILVGVLVGASLALAVFALRWDYERRRTVQLLRNDLEVAQTRARCWEALARYAPKSPADIIPDANKSEWVRQCMATELARLNPKN